MLKISESLKKREREKRKRSRKQYAEKGEWGRSRGPFSVPSLLSFISDISSFKCQHPTPTHTPRFHLLKKPVWWVGIGPVKGPVIQVWGLEGRCEKNQLETPPHPAFPLTLWRPELGLDKSFTAKRGTRVGKMVR